MGNHTLGFIGDSMIRNFGLSVGLFLSDRVDFGDVDNELSMDKVVEKEVCVRYTSDDDDDGDDNADGNGNNNDDNHDDDSDDSVTISFG